MKVWILTSEVNAYDQEGEYFEHVFGDKPTPAQLAAVGVDMKDVAHVLSGGGRRNYENLWWHLREHEITREIQA